MTVRFSGRRDNLDGPAGDGDRFVQDETVDCVVPGAGLVAVTAQVFGVNPGTWTVTASLLDGQPDPAGKHRPRQLDPAAWSWWRWRLRAAAPTPVKTRWAPLAAFTRRPAVVPTSWSLLVLAGVIAALLLQRHTLLRVGLSPDRGLLLSLAAIVAGVVGARLWYLAVNRDGSPHSWSTGWCVQGFLAGIVAALVVGLPVADIPAGRFLDATTPGLFVGLAIGRLGCFFTGCCAGRPTKGRLAMWLSDRRVCARRVPVQLFESLAAATAGVAALVVVGNGHPAVAGSAFVAALAGYTLVRQFLLQLRAERRQTSWGWRTVASSAAVALVVDALLTLAAR